MSAQPQSADTGMTLVEHLVELRKRLVICVIAVAIGMVVAAVRATGAGGAPGRSWPVAVQATSSAQLSSSR